MNLELILSGIFGGATLLSFFIIAYDKQKARKGDSAERIPEVLLFFMAIAFGGKQYIDALR